MLRDGRMRNKLAGRHSRTRFAGSRTRRQRKARTLIPLSRHRRGRPLRTPNVSPRNLKGQTRGSGPIKKSTFVVQSTRISTTRGRNFHFRNHELFFASLIVTQWNYRYRRCRELKNDRTAFFLLRIFLFFVFVFNESQIWSVSIECLNVDGGAEIAGRKLSSTRMT